MQIFQFFGTIKKVYLDEIVELTFLSQFFEDVESLELLQDALFTEKRNLQNALNKINHKDIILCFLYFNLSAKRLKGKTVGFDKRKVNPNLGKLFLRHFESFAKDHNYNIESDDEDYVPEVKKKNKNEENGISLKKIGNLKNPLGNNSSKTNKSKKDYTKDMNDVFVSESQNENSIKEEDLKNKFDFPQINEDLMSDLPKRNEEEEAEIILKKKGVGVKKTGWDSNEMYVYKKKDMSKKEMNNLFPTLGVVTKKKSNQSDASYKSNGISKPGKNKDIGLGNYQNDPVILKKNPWDIPTNLANTNTSINYIFIFFFRC